MIPICFSKNYTADPSNLGCPAVNVYYKDSVIDSSANAYLKNYGGAKLGKP